MSDETVERQDVLANAKLPMPLWEFVTLIAALMALNAFAIDIMLPAMDDIAGSFGIESSNQQQLIFYAYILGFGFPQLVYGPISDAKGRKKLLLICLALYAALAFACMKAPSFTALLAIRFFHGVFASGIRVVSVSIVRDVVAGRAMARVMSLVLTIFMIVPIIAPAIGQGVIYISHWAWTFGVLGVAGILLFIWVYIRLPETLPDESRGHLNLGQAVGAFKAVLSNRMTAGYMFASGVVFGALFAFISSSEQVFSEVFDEEHRFALWFALIASVLAIGNFTNARLVERFGMRRISHTMLFIFILSACLNLLMAYLFGAHLHIFLPLFALSFGCFGMLGANFSAIAMEAQGKVAGTASAVYGFMTSTVSGFLGWLVSYQFDGTLTPILWGYVLLGCGSLLLVLWTEKGHLFSRR